MQLLILILKWSNCPNFIIQTGKMIEKKKKLNYTLPTGDLLVY